MAAAREAGRVASVAPPAVEQVLLTAFRERRRTVRRRRSAWARALQGALLPRRC